MRERLGLRRWNVREQRG
jgi:hypothetical protein